MTAYSQRCPRFETAGCYYEEEGAKNDWLQLRSMISECQRGRKLISVLFGKMTEAKDAMNNGHIGERGDLFQPAVRHLFVLPDEFVFGWLIAHSDLTDSILLALRRKDNKAPHKLLALAVQLPDSLRFDAPMQNTSIFRRLCDARDTHCGERLRKIVENGCLGDDCIYFGECGSYEEEYDDKDRLVKIRHRQTSCEHVVDPSQLLITRTWNLVNNWSDMNAEFQFDAQPGKKAASFFKKDPAEGPWTLTHYSGSKQKGFKDLLEQLVVEWDRERKAVSAHDHTEIKAKIDEDVKETRKNAMVKAKAAAKAALQKAKGLRVSIAKPAENA